MASFDVFVRTPLGRYQGTISLSIDGGAVTGEAAFMVFTTSFSGTASENDLAFSGIFETPAGNVPYSAKAVLSESGIEGSLDTQLGPMTFSSKEGK